MLEKHLIVLTWILNFIVLIFVICQGGWILKYNKNDTRSMFLFGNETSLQKIFGVPKIISLSNVVGALYINSIEMKNII